MTRPPSDKSRGVALALGIPLGIFGAHRFYVGKAQSGVLQLLTLGGMGLWYLYDMILIVGGGFTDQDGRPVVRWGPEDDLASAHGSVPAEVLEELDALRREVAELHDRVDFAERLLADPTRRQPPASG